MPDQHNTDTENTLIDFHGIENQCNYHSLYNHHSLADSFCVGENFSIIHLNARSIKNKFDIFQTFISNTGVEWSIICLSETWLKADMLKYFTLVNYNLFASCRSEGTGGGTAIYVHNSFEVKQCFDLNITNLENTWIEIELRKNNLIKRVMIGCIYRPPNFNSSTFLEYLHKTLDKVDHHNKFVVLAGDFNYNLLNKAHNNDILSFCNLLDSYEFISTISKPTRIVQGSSTLLDKIFVNNHNFFQSSGIIIDDLSDHFPVFNLFRFKCIPSSNNERKTIFNMNKLNDLSEFLVNKLFNFQSLTDPNEACEKLIGAYMEGMEKYSKSFVPCRRKSPIKPWISPGILCSVNHKNKLYRRYIRTRNAHNESKYKQYRNILTKVMREAKRLYFAKAFEESKKDTKATWKHLKEALEVTSSTHNLPSSFRDDTNNIFESDQIPNGFNDYFTSIGTTLEQSMPPSDTSPLNYLNNLDYPPFEDSIVVSPLQIQNIIKSLNAVGGGIDKISTKILIGTYQNCLNHLTHFFNLCLRTATFPDLLKIALVRPIFKSGENDKFTNYRPISLLPILSKILEKIIYFSLTSYITDNNVLSENQFGFRKKHSTYMPVSLIIDNITECLENGGKVIGLYLDLKKAFDTVNKEILLNKLYFLGIRGKLLKIITSYLENRVQKVGIKNSLSDSKNINIGVPQGSILGPLLFILYINDLPLISNLADFYLFADDTAIVIKGNSFEDIQAKINILIPKITKWFLSNRLSLNASKTCYQLYSIHPNNADIDIIINNSKITRTPTVKYLGIIIDENLKFDAHINTLASKISKNIGIMSRVRYFLSSKQLLLLYNSLILPYLNYCAVVWGFSYDSRLLKIIRLQKRALRIIDNKPYFYPSNQLFVKYKMLKVPELVRAQSIVILLAFLNGTLPPIFSRLFKVNRPLNTRSYEHFSVPFTRMNFRLFSISFAAPRAWNRIVGSLYNNIEDVPRSKSVLKNKVRAYLLDKY